MTALDSARIIELHKLLADWGEGTSQATGEEGQGAPATPNDATWRHRFFDTIFWTNEGGDRRGQCKPVGRPCWTVHVEFGADGCRCAIMAGESGQQLRLARVRRRINYYNIKAVRHSGDCQPACADYSIHSRCESSANAAASSHPSAASISPGIRYPATLQRSLPQVAAYCGVSQADQTRCVSCTKQPGSKPVRPYHSRK